MAQSIFVDIIVIIIMACSIINGTIKGVIRSLSGVLKLILGLFGGMYVAKIVSGFASTLLMPLLKGIVVKFLEGMAKNAATETVGNASDTGSILKGLQAAGTPAHDISSMLGADKIIEHAAETVVSNISYIIIFFISFFLISFIVGFILKFLSKAVRMTVIGPIDMIGGALLGAVFGVLIICFGYFILLFFNPSLEQDGKFLSREVLDNTYVAKTILSVMPEKDSLRYITTGLTDSLAR